MTMQEIVEQIDFMLGFSANDNVEGIQTEGAVKIAFRELKRYMRTPIDKTVPYARRINLKDVGIVTTKVLNVRAASPRIGLTMSSIESGNVFQVAAAANVYSQIGNTTSININPIVTEMALAQVRNTLGTDFQWEFDPQNQVIYCPHRAPIPTYVTVQYVPDFQDVSEILDHTWQDYLIRMATANMKIALGRTRSKYTIAGSNVTLDGDVLLNEGNAELDAIRAELDSKKNKLVIVN